MVLGRARLYAVPLGRPERRAFAPGDRSTGVEETFSVASSGSGPGELSPYQIVGTARELRILASAVSRGISATRAVAPMMRSPGSLG